MYLLVKKFLSTYNQNAYKFSFPDQAKIAEITHLPQLTPARLRNYPIWGKCVMLLEVSENSSPLRYATSFSKTDFTDR